MKTLADKTAVIFAAYGEISSEVAKAMALEGANLFLSGRNMKNAQQLAEEVKRQGGKAEAFQVDAMNEENIDSFLQLVVENTGRLDIVFNGIGVRATESGYGTPSLQLSFEDFMKPIRTHLGSQFLTSRAAAKYMMETGSEGTIITLTASLSRIKVPFMAGITSACTAIEGLTRNFAAEFGQAGIKVICLNPTALADTRTIRETNAANSKIAGIPEEEFAKNLKNGYLMGKSPTPQHIGQLAAFLATETGALLNSHVVDADFGAISVI